MVVCLSVSYVYLFTSRLFCCLHGFLFCLVELNCKELWGNNRRWYRLRYHKTDKKTNNTTTKNTTIYYNKTTYRWLLFWFCSSCYCLTIWLIVMRSSHFLAFVLELDCKEWWCNIRLWYRLRCHKQYYDHNIVFIFVDDAWFVLVCYLLYCK